MEEQQKLCADTKKALPSYEGPELGDADRFDQESSEVKQRKWCKLLTVLFFWLVFVCVGLSCGITGPSFLDLLMITNEAIDRGSFLFTFASVGILCGDLLAGILLEKVNVDILLCASTVGSSILLATIPWCESLSLMAVTQAAQRTCVGIIETGLHSLCVQLWGKDIGPPVQVLHFGFAFGGIIGPLVTQPYLSRETDENGASVSDWMFCKNINLTEIAAIKLSAVNLTGNNMTADVTTHSTTCVQTAYFIVGAATLLTAFPFIFMYFQDQKEECQGTKDEHASFILSLSESKRSKRVQVTILVLLATFFAIYACIEITFANYLATFVVENLSWSKSMGAQVTSLFWVCLAAGRFIGIGLSTILSPWKMLAIDLFLLNLSFLGLVLFSENCNWSVWLSTALAGLSLASIFATAFTWTNENIMSLTPRMTTFLLTFSTAGALLNPILLGYLFEWVSPMWFVYLLLGKILICSVIFIGITCILMKVSLPYNLPLWNCPLDK